MEHIDLYRMSNKIMLTKGVSGHRLLPSRILEDKPKSKRAQMQIDADLLSNNLMNDNKHQ